MAKRGSNEGMGKIGQASYALISENSAFEKVFYKINEDHLERAKAVLISRLLFEKL